VADLGFYAVWEGGYKNHILQKVKVEKRTSKFPQKYHFNKKFTSILTRVKCKKKFFDYFSNF